ncbi:conserved membrane protein of unknown function [Candidatus Hydrogenisulfobacillus filiaventi]|uniref:DUF420 domain-containing protein n=1 Tax=Candidatus Hydrogenisulfobacillus filiaventi TaxID=2707344 RepID=A0A6F8ZGL6_9FIRM|nr:conserved membrane protein of unknown function [Candidatus Hydrogenisulfobacillus filiaventi]
MSIESAWALVNELLMIGSAGAIATGWSRIRRGQVEVHRRWMILGASLATLFFLSYLAQSLLVGDTLFGGPRSWALAYQAFLQVHVILATLAGALGIVTLRLALKGRFPVHRKVAPWTVVFWFVAAATGLGVYLLLFTIFTPGPTTGNLVHVVLGTAAGR